MNWKRISIVVLLILLVVCIVLTVSKPELLTENTLAIKTLPFGNLLSWVIIFAYALLMQLLYPHKSSSVFEKVFSKLIFLNAICALFWGLISFFLAGNWSFVFADGPRFQLWIGFAVWLIVLPLFGFILLGFRKLFIS